MPGDDQNAVSHRSDRARKPVSSTSSRAAHASGDSPGSSVPAGQLEQLLPHRVAELPHEQHAPRRRDRRDDHGARVQHDFALDVAAVGERHAVDDDLEPAAFEDGLAVHGVPL